MTSTTTEPSLPSTSSLEIEKLIDPALYRLTDGLPTKELQMMVSEAKSCETLLEQEIQLLEKALASEDSLLDAEKSSVDRMINIEFTPPDRFFTISTLLGRLREPLAPPLPPNSAIAASRLKSQHNILQPPTKKKKTNASVATSNSSAGIPTEADSNNSNNVRVNSNDKIHVERLKQLLKLDGNPEYRRRHTDPTKLLAAWKRISSHRTAGVFRRPVRDGEAPGYTERILFPIDLSLIRKMIMSGMIISWADLHQRLSLICHNCVKFNGRESDYGIVTREFESYMEEVLLQLIGAVSRASTPTVANHGNSVSNIDSKPDKLTTGSGTTVASVKKE
mmetsp:Transcript_2609/g.3951  ORF Transcript_2609/g.3951 Transcript_2609/m.3951 type:complete len:335 (-) Transcript_2609:251-1255(-)